jgi:hypothetical protein
MKNIPTEAIPNRVAKVKAPAATSVERCVRATMGTNASRAGTARTRSAPTPSLATRDSWLDVHDEMPVGADEHEVVETTGAKARTVPVAAAAPSVTARQR